MPPPAPSVGFIVRRICCLLTKASTAWRSLGRARIALVQMVTRPTPSPGPSRINHPLCRSPGFVICGHHDRQPRARNVAVAGGECLEYLTTFGQLAPCSGSPVSASPQPGAGGASRGSALTHRVGFAALVGIFSSAGEIRPSVLKEFCASSCHGSFTPPARPVDTARVDRGTSRHHWGLAVTAWPRALSHGESFSITTSFSVLSHIPPSPKQFGLTANGWCGFCQQTSTVYMLPLSLISLVPAANRTRIVRRRVILVGFFSITRSRRRLTFAPTFGPAALWRSERCQGNQRRRRVIVVRRSFATL